MALESRMRVCQHCKTYIVYDPNTWTWIKAIFKKDEIPGQCPAFPEGHFPNQNIAERQDRIIADIERKRDRDQH